MVVVAAAVGYPSWLFVEAVAPIIPLTLRDNALDGGYLRTELQFLGAAEFMFAQYESDVRAQANPNGVVG